jgi:hypothetical protein
MFNLLSKKIHNESKLCIKGQRNLDKLLDKPGFIYSIKTTQWLSPIVIVLKKNGKLHICVDYRKLNAQTKKDPFPLPFLDSILDGYSRYMAKKDKEKQHSFQNGVHMHITLYHLDYVMLLSHFKK